LYEIGVGIGDSTYFFFNISKKKREKPNISSNDQITEEGQKEERDIFLLASI